mgnify:FL=1
MHSSENKNEEGTPANPENLQQLFDKLGKEFSTDKVDSRFGSANVMPGATIEGVEKAMRECIGIGLEIEEMLRIDPNVTLRMRQSKIRKILDDLETSEICLNGQFAERLAVIKEASRNALEALTDNAARDAFRPIHWLGSFEIQEWGEYPEECLFLRDTVHALSDTATIDVEELKSFKI